MPALAQENQVWSVSLATILEPAKTPNHNHCFMLIFAVAGALGGSQGSAVFRNRVFANPRAGHRLKRLVPVLRDIFCGLKLCKAACDADKRYCSQLNAEMSCDIG